MSGIVAVIPAYNEAAHITGVVEQARAFLPVLVVDDGSRDNTAALAGAAGAEVLRQVPNKGKGTALRTGFHWALAQGYEAAITLDADGQHDPQEIPAFLAADRASHPDLLIGAREYSAMPVVRRTSNTIGRWMLNWALGQPVADNQSGYRLLSRRMMESVLDSREDSFEFEVEMIATCLLNEYRLDWVPIRTIYAGEASHIQPLRHVVHFFRVAWQTRQRMQTGRRVKAVQP